MLTLDQWNEIERIWRRKLAQDEAGLPLEVRHRNLEPASAEFIHALALGASCLRLLEIGGSSGLSTIALASAAKALNGRVTSLEKEPARQHESKATIKRLGLSAHVEYVLGDATDFLAEAREFDFVLIDCEKEDYARFFDMLRLPVGGIVVADNILSHDLSAYTSHVRGLTGFESILLPIGKGLEVTKRSVPA